MAWYHPELYHRVLSYSGTFVNQQWPYHEATPHGAWEFHEHLIPENKRMPLRIWTEVGDRDLLNPNVMRDGMHDWVLANENMAKVLAAQGCHYQYQFVFARNAGHTDRAVKQQTLPEALEYIMAGVPYRRRVVLHDVIRAVSHDIIKLDAQVCYPQSELPRERQRRNVSQDCRGRARRHMGRRS